MKAFGPVVRFNILSVGDSMAEREAARPLHTHQTSKTAVEIRSYTRLDLENHPTSTSLLWKSGHRLDVL